MLEEILERIWQTAARIIIVLVTVIAFIALVASLRPEPEFWDIVLKNSMRVTVYIDSSLPFDTAWAKRFLLHPGETLTVTRIRSKISFSQGRRETTHVTGWLEDGTKVDIPWPELQEELGE